MKVSICIYIPYNETAADHMDNISGVFCEN